MFDLLITGQYYHSKGFEDFSGEIKSIGIIDGKIRYIGDGIKPAAKHVVLDPNQFLIPGLIDTHIHAPQMVFTGTGYDKTLLDWLETYTFPRESKFQDLEYARTCYEKVVKRTLYNGTTTACYFATIHEDSSVALAEICAAHGQRAYIGKVCMDRNSPKYYTETTCESLDASKRFSERVIELNNPLITPCITPRFVPSCTSELMQGLGDYATLTGLPIQSHLSENENEIKWVEELHPEHESYAQIYNYYGLLSSMSVMAHCIHLSDDERKLMLKNNCGISHCASSNFGLNSGVLNVAKLIDEGFVKIGLGTDVGGGYSTSILDAIRQSIIASKVSHIQSRKEEKVYRSLGFREAFYMATLGGARALNLESKIGNFEIGKEFDALLIDIKPNVESFDHDDNLSVFEKFIYLGDDRNITSVYVAGKQVK